MKETSDNAMDVDMDGASGNIDMGPSTLANENSTKKVQLAELPKEMLEEILIHLDARNLLNASHVCKLFASVAETAFARKYSMEYYHNHDYGNRSLDKVILNKYGGKIRKISIYGFLNEEILDLVEQKCDNVKSFWLHNAPRLLVFRNLKEAKFDAVRNVDRETFTKFIDINPQLETLELMGSAVDSLDLLDGRLHKLKTLKYASGICVGRLLPLRLRSLESLHLHTRKKGHCIPLMQAMNCNQIKKLRVISRDNDSDDNFINEICKFETLVSLDLTPHHTKLDEVGKLAARLPHLTEFATGMTMFESGPDSMTESMISMLPKLTIFTVTLDKYNFDRVFDELKKSPEEFHTRFAKNNLKIVLKIYDMEMTSTTDRNLSITTDRIYMSCKGGSIELYWMNNLNEQSVREAMAHSKCPPAVTFINRCVDRPFDISTLAHMNSNRNGIKCLNFKSNGPINVSENVLRYSILFPDMKTLNIHLEQHSANDFLRNLDANFCKQIKKLWLNAKGANTTNEDEDMTRDLSKFENLESLCLSSSIKFDADRLFPVCRNLKEIKLIPRENRE